MTVFTDIRSLAVIKGYCCGTPRATVMTSLAQVAGHRMRGRLKGTRAGAIVTTGTGTSGRSLVVRKWTD